MAKKKAKDAGQEFLKELLAKVPEEQRTAVQEALAGEEILSTLGEGVMMRSDYSKGQDELQRALDVVAADKKNLDDWYVENKETLLSATKYKEEVTKLRQKLSGLDLDGGDDSAVARAAAQAANAGISKEDVEKIIRDARGQVENQTLGIVTVISKLGLQHMKDYGEVLDPQTLMDHTRKLNEPFLRAGKPAQFNLESAYREMTAERAAEMAETRSKAEREKIREEIEAEVRAKIQAETGHSAYPVSDEVSTLAGLGAEPNTYGVSAAVDEFHKQRAARGQ